MIMEWVLLTSVFINGYGLERSRTVFESKEGCYEAMNTWKDSLPEDVKFWKENINATCMPRINKDKPAPEYELDTMAQCSAIADETCADLGMDGYGECPQKMQIMDQCLNPAADVPMQVGVPPLLKVDTNESL